MLSGRKDFDLIYQRLFCVEQPFGEPEENYHRFVSKPKQRSLEFQGLPYRIISEKVIEYVQQDKLELAIKSAHMKLNYQEYMNRIEDIQALHDLCEIALIAK